MDELKAREQQVIDELFKAYNMLDFDLVLELSEQLTEIRKEKEMMV